MWQTAMSSVVHANPVQSEATERQQRVWDKRAPMYDRSMGLMESCCLATHAPGSVPRPLAR